MDTLKIEDAVNYERARYALVFAKLIADESKNETVKALAAMLSATAEEIIKELTDSDKGKEQKRE